MTATLICPLTYPVGRTRAVIDVKARGYNVMLKLIREIKLMLKVCEAIYVYKIIKIVRVLSLVDR